MKKITFLALITIAFTSCFMSSNTSKNDSLYLIETTMGDIKIRLYDETPLHKENFVKLVEENFYDSVLFHRVIKGFMVQTGDPDSKNAQPGSPVGTGGPGYTIEAEIVDSFYHKKGALAAARQGDQMNPERRSSGSQFYIVQGEILTNQQLDMLEQNINQQRRNQLIMKYIQQPENANIRQKIDSLQRAGDTEGLNQLGTELEAATQDQFEAQGAFSFTEEQREIYTTVGGTPHLDGTYTVFGEVVEGLEVLDKIAATETGQRDRPKVDIRILDIRKVKK